MGSVSISASSIDSYGVHVEDNRTQDQYNLRAGGPASSPCDWMGLFLPRIKRSLL